MFSASMNTDILLCCDLDRTLLPNGPQPESPQARPLLHKLAVRPEITLVYVSGRHRQLLIDAIREYDLPLPDYAIGDVGSTIYHVTDHNWQQWDEWQQEIAPDWHGKTHDQLAALLADMDQLRLQEKEKQNTFKLSYYGAQDSDRDALLAEITRRFVQAGVDAHLIWSIDDIAHVGLLDILPASANKLHAINYLSQQQGFDPSRTVFAGDSGNDLPVLASNMRSILVANATDSVHQEAIRLATKNGSLESLYVASGGFMGMNGNYAAGVLEGVAHYFPHISAWLE